VTNSVRRTDVVARLGGDEFALLIAGADRTGAEGLIAKVMHSLRDTLDCEQSVVTCSIGCVTFLSPPIDAATAIGTADALMYEVKNQGKNAVAFEVVDDQPGNSAEVGAGPKPRQAAEPLRSQVAARAVERGPSIEPRINKIVPRT
jgi:predicted signal transduction protein with EAL and GGDEF domain